MLNKAKFRSFSLFALALLVFYTITSCDNFTNASDVRLQIEQNIAYNMASPYTIALTSSISGSGSFRAPVAADSVEKKVTDSFTLTYEPSPDFAFIEWKVTDKKTGNPASGYLTFENVGAETTTCTFFKAPDAGMELSLCAVVTERPDKLDCFPAWSSEGVRCDSRIQVRFTKPMDESSIYYNDKERKAIEQQEHPDTFLPETAGLPKYGYRKGQEQYWKNIIIVDNYGKTMLQHFKKPFFENTKTLVIEADSNNLATEGTEFFITINKNFLCKETGETTSQDITLKRSIVWSYVVNDKIDDQPPSIPTFSINDSQNNALATYEDSESSPTMLSKGNVNLNVEVKDLGSGPAGTFFFELENTKTNETQDIPIKFKSVLGSKAKYSGEYTFDVNDGNYTINKISVSDQSSKTKEQSFTPPYYIAIDNNPPNVVSFKVEPYAYNADNKGKLECTYSVFSDEINLAGIRIKSRESGDNTDWNQITGEKDYPTTQLSTSIALDALPFGKTYDIRAEFYDKANNSTVLVLKNVETLPNPLDESKVSITPIREQGEADKVKISWEPPEGPYSGVYIVTDSGGFIVPDSSNTHEFITNTLDYDKNYTFNIYTIKGNGNSNLERSAECVTKEIYTKPAAPSDRDITVSVHLPNIEIRTSKNYLKVRYKKSTDTEYSEPTEINHTDTGYYTHTVGTLEPATQYDVMITRYNSTSGLESDPYYVTNQYTEPDKPKNLNVTTYSTTESAVLVVNWTKPQGNFDSYTIEYKIETANNNSEWERIPDISKAAETYEISDCNFLSHYLVRIRSVCKPYSTILYSEYVKITTPVDTLPQAAGIECSFTDTYDVKVNWNLPYETYKDATIELYYGEDESTFKQGNKHVSLQWQSPNLIIGPYEYTPKPVELTRSTIGIYDQNCYFAIKTTCKNSSNQDVTSWSEVKSLLMPPDIKAPTSVTIAMGGISSDTLIIQMQLASGQKWDKINIYVNEEYNGSYQNPNPNVGNNSNSNNYFYVIAGLQAETSYTISARTEYKNSESIPKTITQETFYALPNTSTTLNLRTQGNYLLWNSSYISGHKVDSTEIKRVRVRYRKVNDPNPSWTDAQDTPSVMVSNWSGGLDPKDGNWQISIPNAESNEVYIIELETYGGTMISVKRLSTNSVTYTVP